MVKPCQFRHSTRFFMKKKDKNVGRGDNKNNFSGEGGGKKKKEKDPSKIRDRLQPTTNKQFELENTESNGNGGIAKDNKMMLEYDFEVRYKIGPVETLRRWGHAAFIRNARRKFRYSVDLKKAELDNGNNGNGGGDDDNNGGGGGKNNKKDSGRDGDGNGDKYKCGLDNGGGYTKGKNMDFMGKAGFGYRYGYHAGNENEYPVGQLQCVQEVQSSDTKCLFCHARTKKKNKNSGGDDNKNNCNKRGDGKKKKEKDPSKIQDRVQQKTMKQLELENTESNDGGITKNNKMVLEQYDFNHTNSPEETQEFVTGVLKAQTQLEATKDQHMGPSNNGLMLKPMPALSLPDPVSELDAAAVKIQKVYKSYRTRRSLADSAVLAEHLWWKALDFAALKSFFNVEKPQTAVSRWRRARTRATMVGKGLSEDDKAQALALQHWLEAIDPQHRCGHNLHMYYDVWVNSQSSQPFFYWLDIGDGKRYLRPNKKDKEDNYHGDCGGYDDNNGSGGGENNKNGSNRDSDGNGHKDEHSPNDGGGEMKGKNMDFIGDVGFGYRYGYHAGNENGYPVGQLPCAQEVQSSEPKCLFYHAIMIS